MKKISGFLFENFQFLMVKFSIYLNKHVCVMDKPNDQKLLIQFWHLLRTIRTYSVLNSNIDSHYACVLRCM